MSQPIAFALLKNSEPTDLQAVVGVLRQRHPERSWSTDAEISPPHTFIRCDNQIVAVATADAPLPSDEGVWQRATRSWPDARNEIAHHRAHVVVALMSTADNKIDGARIVTAVAGAMVACSAHVCGIVFGGIVARSPQIWLDMSRNAFAPYPEYPFMLWIDIVPVHPDPKSTAVLTVGLVRFAGREIEFEVPGLTGSALIQRVAGLAAYMIEHGDRIKDGDRIGDSTDERVTVHHRISRFAGAPVLRIGPDLPGGQFKVYAMIDQATAKTHPLLVLLHRAGLFDAASQQNQVVLQPDRYASEKRLDSFDNGISGMLSKLQASGVYVVADQKARDAFARDDVETAKSALLPFAEEVRTFQAALKLALMKGDAFMFPPKQQPPARQPWYKRLFAG